MWSVSRVFFLCWLNVFFFVPIFFDRLIYMFLCKSLHMYEYFNIHTWSHIFSHLIIWTLDPAQKWKKKTHNLNMNNLHFSHNKPRHGLCSWNTRKLNRRQRERQMWKTERKRDTFKIFGSVRMKTLFELLVNRLRVIAHNLRAH